MKIIRSVSKNYLNTHTHSIYYVFYMPDIVLDTISTEINIKAKNLAHLVFIMATEG